MVKVTGTNFVRDTTSMGLSNINQAEKDEYYTRSRMLSTQKNEINKVKDEIQSIKNDMGEIKELMLKLLDKNTHG